MVPVKIAVPPSWVNAGGAKDGVDNGLEQLNPTESVALAREANDRLADAVRKHPSRFRWICCIAAAAPDAATADFERTVHNYGFKGAVVDGHIQGRDLDDQFFWRITMKAPITGLGSVPLRVDLKYR